MNFIMSDAFIVAPFVGAWIEIRLIPSNKRLRQGSLPSWERGLKSDNADLLRIPFASLPSWERGLKFTPSSCAPIGVESLPSWERGLKSPEIYRIVTLP